jgi:hypothetical protein
MTGETYDAAHMVYFLCFYGMYFFLFGGKEKSTKKKSLWVMQSFSRTDCPGSKSEHPFAFSFSVPFSLLLRVRS